MASGAYTIVTRVATQGGKSVSQWVTKYMLQHSDDRFIFQTYQETTGNSAMVCFDFNNNCRLKGDDIHSK